MATFTFRIPQALEQKFEAHKGKFNVSATCQAAIEKEVDFYDFLEHRMSLSQTERLIERLKKEKSEFDDMAFQSGRKAGIKGIESLAYEEIHFVLKAIREDWDAHSVVGHFEREICSDTGGSIRELFEEEGFGKAHFNSYVQGWLEGVEAAWAEIEDEVESA